MVQLLARLSFAGWKRQASYHLLDAGSQFQDEVSLSGLYAQVRTDRLRYLGSSRVGDLPCPSRPPRIIGVVIFPDPPAERLGKKGRDLRGYLIQANYAYVVRRRFASRPSRLISSGYQDRAVTIDATGHVCAQRLVHNRNYIKRPQCQGLGTVKQLGAVAGHQFGAGVKGNDMEFWPEDLRVREFPRTPPRHSPARHQQRGVGQ